MKTDNRVKIGEQIHYKVDGDEYWSTVLGYQQDLFTEQLMGYRVSNYCNLGLMFNGKTLDCLVPLEKIISGSPINLVTEENQNINY